jgi:hypothetical protein
MEKASANGNEDRVRLNAEAILNTLVGSQSPDYKDWNTDGQADDPSDGYGLLLNGRNQGYLNDTFIQADAAAKVPGSSEQMKRYGESLKSNVQILAQWTEQLKQVTMSILATPPPSDLAQRVTQAVVLADKMLNGIDLDENGVIESVPGEAGVLIVYEQAYRMADMPLQAVGIQNLGTGTPTFILVAPSKTPGGDGGEGPTTGPTQNVPPGQQKTKEPPPGKEKTKDPKPANSSNNGNSGNNDNNGNNDNK